MSFGVWKLGNRLEQRNVSSDECSRIFIQVVLVYSLEIIKQKAGNLGDYNEEICDTASRKTTLLYSVGLMQFATSITRQRIL